MVYIVMGVAGSGKSTIGSMLARRLGLPYQDADDYHPVTNKEKMKAGIPLDDADREPWLELLSGKIMAWNREGGAVLACSALKKAYRLKLSGDEERSVLFIYLEGNRETIVRRIKERPDHYFPPELLDSQFADLEAPEEALVVSIEGAPEALCREIVERIQLQ
jgi:carbohydrate kinase (thermoresistant glucokinase family)